MNILIAPNSFKESLNSDEIAKIIARELCNLSTEFTCIQMPLSDGGAGFLRIMVHALCGIEHQKKVTGPLGSAVRARYGLCREEQTGIIELAQAAGLCLVPRQKRDPLIANTSGVGELMRAAVRKGATRILLGIGDSATIDCGIGALSALGVRFFDRHDRDIPLNCRGLLRLHRVCVRDVPRELMKAHITVAADVDNILTGPDGALMYAAQKGATRGMVPVIDRALHQFKKVVHQHTGVDLDQVPGSGASGGIGGGFRAILGAELVDGFSVVRNAVRLDTYVKKADCVITGEGRIDTTSHRGKASARMIEMARMHEKPVILIAGDSDGHGAYSRLGAIGIYTLAAGHSRRYAMMHARKLLATVARRIGQELLDAGI